MKMARFLHCNIVLGNPDGDTNSEEERFGVRITESDDDEEFESPCVIDLLEAAVIFKAIQADEDKPDPEETAIMLKSGRTIWVRVSYNKVMRQYLDALT